MRSQFSTFAREAQKAVARLEAKERKRIRRMFRYRRINK